MRRAPYRRRLAPDGFVRLCAWVAQLVEQRIENPRVTGSIPVPGTISRSGNPAFSVFNDSHVAVASMAAVSGPAWRALAWDRSHAASSPPFLFLRSACAAGASRSTRPRGRYVDGLACINKILVSQAHSPNRIVDPRLAISRSNPLDAWGRGCERIEDRNSDKAVRLVASLDAEGFSKRPPGAQSGSRTGLSIGERADTPSDAMG